MSWDDPVSFWKFKSWNLLCVKYVNSSRIFKRLEESDITRDIKKNHLRHLEVHFWKIIWLVDWCKVPLRGSVYRTANRMIFQNLQHWWYNFERGCYDFHFVWCVYTLKRFRESMRIRKGERVNLFLWYFKMLNL